MRTFLPGPLVFLVKSRTSSNLNRNICFTLATDISVDIVTPYVPSYPPHHLPVPAASRQMNIYQLHFPNCTP
jgi:hypothetical protein